MPLATGVNLAKAFGGEQIFAGVSFEIQERDRIALVGVNGSGKSTLLRLIAGLEQPDRGSIRLAGGAGVAYLPQEVTFPPGVTLERYMLGAFERLRQVEVELRRVEQALGAAGQDGPATDVEALLERHGQLLHEYEDGGGYRYQSQLREVLAGLGIGEDRLPQPLDSFSGGQRTRVALARLLLTTEDLLLLDEPTNHLDLAASEWLESFLAQARPAVVVVSHDRYFLDKVAARTWELSGGQLDAYNGNYTQFAQQKAERLARQEKDYAAQQAHIARTEAFIRRYRAGQRARAARGRQKQLNRLERASRPREQAQLRVIVQSTLRSGDTVLALEDLAVAPGVPAAPTGRLSPGQPLVRAAARDRSVPQESILFRSPDVEVRRGERVAIVGPNGSGKTTLLRVIAGETGPAAGRVYLGYGVQLAYYAQAHEQLDPARTVLAEVQSVQPLGEEAARAHLARFLFTGDDLAKLVAQLSGGERSRLALAKLALSNANVLVLDEPTNHLDVYARAALEDVLTGYNGTILFASHDRYLIDALASHVWEIAGGRLTPFTGSWSDYLAVRAEIQAGPARPAGKTPAPAPGRAGGEAPRPGTRDRRATRERAGARLARLEAEIAEWEARLATLTAELATASAGGDPGRIAELGRQYSAAAAALAEREEVWLTLSEAGESADTPMAGTLVRAGAGGGDESVR